MKIVIDGELPDLNTDIGIIRSHVMAYSDHKEEWTNYCWGESLKKRVKIPDDNFPVRIAFVWYTKDLKKDCDNIAFAKKYILDGLKLAKVIPNDSRRFVSCFGGEFFKVDKKKPRVEIHIFSLKYDTSEYLQFLYNELPYPEVQ